jgi:hypothetical protein
MNTGRLTDKTTLEENMFILLLTQAQNGFSGLIQLQVCTYTWLESIPIDPPTLRGLGSDRRFQFAFSGVF